MISPVPFDAPGPKGSTISAVEVELDANPSQDKELATIDTASLRVL